MSEKCHLNEDYKNFIMQFLSAFVLFLAVALAQGQSNKEIESRRQLIFDNVLVCGLYKTRCFNNESSCIFYLICCNS